ncbi:MAG: gamma-glutamyltransferase [Betaproteobacteria bacterium]
MGLTRRAFVAFLAACGLALGCAVASAGARHGVAAAHPLAVEAGERVLAAGGNAFDAAVAVASTLAVVEPFSSGFGGGGFFLVHRAADGRDIMIDAREMAPGAATPRMYLRDNGEVDTRASLDGARAAGIPGLAAGLAHLSARYGSRPFAEVLAPAIAHAANGFAIDARYAAAAGWRESALRTDPPAAAVFLQDGRVPDKGFTVRQPDLAATIRALARDGRDGFYRGPVAREMVRAVQAGGGIWVEEDLAGYRVVERAPMRFTYRGATITTASLPSSGGVTLAQALHILERYDLAGLGPVDRAHLVVEALRRAYHDRSRFLGDSDFVEMPLARLASRAYADEKAASIDRARATPSATLEAAPAPGGGTHTTHFSVVDAAGNRVAATLSINGPFGAGMVAGATGVLLNNEMNDFAIVPGISNLYGLTGSVANGIVAGKRPLSSMSPTFVEDSRGVLVFGTPGGSRIISMVLLGILEHLSGGPVDLARVAGAPRFHHQYLPDRIEIEPGQFSAEWVEGLRALGHVVQEGRRRWGNLQAVFVDAVTGEVSAESDLRGRSGVLF